MVRIGNILYNTHFKYSKDYIIHNQLSLVSLECNDRVCRGMNWDDKLFRNQDSNKYLGKIISIDTHNKGGYEIQVEWDDKSQYNYRFGLSSMFDVDIVQRRSRCKHSNIVPLFVNDKVIRSISWKWGKQDLAIGFDDDDDDDDEESNNNYNNYNNNNKHVIPQIGIIRGIQNNGNDDEDDEDQLYDTRSVHYYINNLPKDDFINDTLVIVHWIKNKYDENVNQQPIKINENGLYDYSQRKIEKYRYGFQDSFDVTVIGQHSSLHFIPFNKFRNNINNNFVENYENIHKLDIQQMIKAKDVLYASYYKQEQDKNNESTKTMMSRLMLKRKMMMRIKMMTITILINYIIFQKHRHHHKRGQRLL